jgi:NAD(P)H-hydrate epimerase
MVFNDKHLKGLPERKDDSHKGDYGKVFILAGSVGMTGAAYLTAEAAMRSGSGLVINGIPESLNDIMEVKLTEVMTLPLPEIKARALGAGGKAQILEFAAKCQAVAIGPGLGRNEETMKLVRDLVKELECPVVLDADGIVAFEGKYKLLKKRRSELVITPHPGEMARLTGKSVDEIQDNRVECAKELSAEINAVVCLKGHKTVVANPEGFCYVNTTGNSGMATGGTGDILTGMIASFLGQGVTAYSAAISGVYVHGIAGDIAASKKGPFCMIAGDMLEYLPLAFDKAGIY